MALTVSAAAAQAMGAALATDLGSGAIIDVYSGSKPATVATAATGTKLFTVTISGSFSSSGGVLTAADPASVAPIASGTAGYFRVSNATGPTAKLDGTVGTSGTDLILGSTTITTGVNVDLGVPTITVPLL